ncbi:MAG TPA: U-box domain-containing protein [Myxococcota bacterium]|nr:U-box domain-containing protein [Myxococcota bacterium]
MGESMIRGEAPQRFVDYITYDLMVDPVVMTDGKTVDRTTAEQLKTSPWTGEPVSIAADNVDLRGELFEYCPQQQVEYRRRKKAAANFEPALQAPATHEAQESPRANESSRRTRWRAPRRSQVAKWSRQTLMALPVGTTFVVAGVVGVPLWFLVDPIIPGRMFKRGGSWLALPVAPVIGAFAGVVVTRNVLRADVWRPRDVWDAAWGD